MIIRIIMTQDYPDCSIVDIEQNTEKSPRDMRRLAVTQLVRKKLAKK